MLDSLPRALSAERDIPSLSWDQVCDLLVGADWPAVPATIQSIPQFRTRFSLGRQFLFQDDPSRLSLESLWLKLSAFARLCRRVAEFYEQHQRPYLSLEPKHIHACVRDQTFTWLPARWVFALELDATKGPTPLVHETMPSEMARHVLVSSSDIDSTYIAPIMKQWPVGRELRVTVLLRSVERVSDDTDQDSRGLVRAHVFSETASFTDFSERDVFHLVLRLPGNGSKTVSLWARKVEEAERGLVVSGLTEPIPNVTWAQLQGAKQQVFSDAVAHIYRAFHHGCDLYGLGLLLFRSLLVTQRLSLEQVKQQVGEVLERLEPLVQGLHPDDNWTLFMRVSGRLQEHQGIFRPPAETSLPEYLWYDALILGLRLVSWIPGFSFCESPGARDEKPVPDALRRTVGMAELMAEQARLDLFDASARHHDLNRLCDLVLTERM